MASLPDSRRDTPAANADLLGDDASFDGSLEQAGDLARPASGGAKPAGAVARGTGLERGGGGRAGSGEAPAGKDINQAGFVKDPGAAKP